MSFRRRMLVERRDTTAWQRARCSAHLAVAVGVPAFASRTASYSGGSSRTPRPRRGLRQRQPAPELADRSRHRHSETSGMRAFESTWWQDVQYVAPTVPGITVGEPARRRGQRDRPAERPLINALVEVTWQLGDEQFRTSHRTTALGRRPPAAHPSVLQGKRCLVSGPRRARRFRAHGLQRLRAALGRALARVLMTQCLQRPPRRTGREPDRLPACVFTGGDEGARTLDPRLAKPVLSQLSYVPVRGRV